MATQKALDISEHERFVEGNILRYMLRERGTAVVSLRAY
jgi:hypothetical protein